MPPPLPNWFDFLKPGDVLMYSKHGPIAWLIKHVSNSRMTHCEVYMGNGRTAASRDGIGVGTYPFDAPLLALVLRPAFFDLKSATEFHIKHLGEPYDYMGLVRAFVCNIWGKDDKAWWCSEYVTALQRAGGINPFPTKVPCDEITPGDLEKSDAYTWVWEQA